MLCPMVRVVSLDVYTTYTHFVFSALNFMLHDAYIDRQSSLANFRNLKQNFYCD